MVGVPSALSRVRTLILDRHLSRSQPQPPRTSTGGFIPSLYKEIVTDFVEALGYCPPSWRGATWDISMTPTYKSLLAEFSAYDSGDGWVEATCLSSAAYGELPYPNQSEEIRLQIARFTWFLLYIDDLGHKAPSVLKAFQRSLFENKNVEDTPLQGFRDNLASIYSSWDTIPADCITTSGMEFLTGRLMEIEPAIQEMKITTVAQSWPEYLREKNGAAAAYAFMIFPTATGVDLSTYVQAMEDMKLVIKYSNDLLSFYKESLAGETDNYIHNRSCATCKSVPETLRDVANEVVAAQLRVDKILQNTNASEGWKNYTNGNMDFYFSTPRYRLGELGF